MFFKTLGGPIEVIALRIGLKKLKSKAAEKRREEQSFLPVQFTKLKQGIRFLQSSKNGGGCQFGFVV